MTIILFVQLNVNTQVSPAGILLIVTYPLLIILELNEPVDNVITIFPLILPLSSHEFS